MQLPSVEKRTPFQNETATFVGNRCKSPPTGFGEVSVEDVLCPQSQAQALTLADGPLSLDRASTVG